MNYFEFRNKMFLPGCFTPGQVYAWCPDFNKSNLVRWEQKKYLVKLRNGYYSFPEYIAEKDFSFYVANRMYRPSYVSLHTALAFFGLIPESVVQVTSVSTLKSASFINSFGTFSYHSVLPSLMFGYDTRPMQGGRSILFAKPEKAMLDLLYLYPFYNSVEELEALRIDHDILQDNFNAGLFRAYVTQINSRAVERRAELLFTVYNL